MALPAIVVAATGIIRMQVLDLIKLGVDKVLLYRRALFAWPGHSRLLDSPRYSAEGIVKSNVQESPTTSQMLQSKSELTGRNICLKAIAK